MRARQGLLAGRQSLLAGRQSLFAGRRLALALAAALSLARADAPDLPIYVDADPAAARRYAEARVAEADGRTAEAAEAWRDLASRHGRALVEVEPGLWRSAADLAREHVRPDAASARTQALLALEAGRPAEADHWLGDVPSDDPCGILLAARAAAEEGSLADAEEVSDRARGMRTPVRVGDAELPLEEAVSRILSRTADVPSANGWPTAPALRNVPPIEGPLVCWKEFPLAAPRHGGSADLRDRVLAAQLASAGTPAFAPAVDGGLLVLRDAERVEAIDLASGASKWTDRTSPVGCPVHLAGGRISGRPACSLWSPVLCGDRVWIAAEAPRDAGVGIVRVRALSRETGLPVFDSGSVPDDWLAHATLAAAPMPRGGVVYALFASLGAEEQYHLVAIDAARGRVVWRTFLYALLGGPSHLFDWALGASAIGTIAESGGTLYVGSNAGLVLAVDRTDGRVRWARRYDAIPPGGARVAVDDGANGWAANPLLLDGDRVLAAPTDAEALLVLRRADGAQIASVPRRGRRYLLGVTGNLAYVAGSEAACVDLATGADRWVRPLEGRPFGRGFLAPAGVYHATDRALVCLRPEDGEIVWGPCTWPAAGAGDGTLLPAGEGILCAAGTHASLAIPRRVFDSAMAARLGRAPEDGDLLVLRGEAYEKAGYEDEALADYREVISRDAAARPERGRLASLRANALLATRAARLEGEGRLQEALSSWREALEVAREDAAQFAARTRVAELLERTGDSAASLTAWEEVLSRHPAAIREEGEARWSGRALATARIAAIRARSGAPNLAAAPAVPCAAEEEPTLAWDRLSERSPLTADGGWPWDDEAGEPAGEEAEGLSLLPVAGEIVVRRGRTLACLEAGASRVRWMTRLAGDAEPRAVRAGDLVVVQEAGRLVGIDLASGKVRWEQDPGAGTPLGEPWGAGDRLARPACWVVAAVVDRVEGVRLVCVGATGEALWRAVLPGSTHTQIRFHGGEAILFDPAASRLAVVDLADGVERWTRWGRSLLPAGGPVDRQGQLAGWQGQFAGWQGQFAGWQGQPAGSWGVAGGAAIVLAGKRRLAAWSLATGEMEWEVALPADVCALAFSEAGIALGGSDGRLRVVDPATGRVELDRAIGFPPAVAAWQGQLAGGSNTTLALAGTAEGRWRVVVVRRSSEGTFSEAPGLDLADVGGVSALRVVGDIAVVESPCGDDVSIAARRLGTSEILWEQTFPCDAGERPDWRAAGGVLAEASRGVVRLFGPVEER